MSSPFDTLADRIRTEADIASRSGQTARLHALADEVESLRAGAKTLGEIVTEQGSAALDATGMHHAINNDGDGDWAAVWERLAEMGGR